MKNKSSKESLEKLHHNQYKMSEIYYGLDLRVEAIEYLRRLQCGEDEISEQKMLISVSETMKRSIQINYDV